MKHGNEFSQFQSYTVGNNNGGQVVESTKFFGFSQSEDNTKKPKVCSFDKSFSNKLTEWVV